MSGRIDYRVVRFSGRVRDAFQSRTNPFWAILIVSSSNETVYVALPRKEKPPDFFLGLIGAHIALVGVTVPQDDGFRAQIGRTFKCSGADAIEVLRPAPADPFVAPDVSAIANLRPGEIARLDRHRAAGDVIAVWQKDKVLLRTANDRIVRLELSQTNAPAFGSTVEAVGFPESDLYRINLSHASWRTLPGTRRPRDPARPTSAAELTSDRTGHPRIDVTAHGRAVRLTGILKGLPTVGPGDGVLYIDDGGYLVPIDVSANRPVLKGLEIGCRLEVSGTCVINIDSWRPNAIFPRVSGFTVVVRTPEDVRVLARPSWWTPGRLAAAVGILLAALLGFAVWNRVLNRLANRRSRELFKEQVAHYGADLRVEERTRLAVELHDSIAQNLTGVAMEIETAEQFTEGANDELKRHLSLAARSLTSSRAELRNCLWDLRNQALEETDMNKAIEWALLPHVKGVALSIDFDLPRRDFSDKTIHSMLCIVRELTVNGIRHGGAKSVTIHGRMQDEQLTFSVADDGCGFDPDSSPGVLQGHFGLQGIRERLKPFGGRIDIDSRPGHGTTVTITLRSNRPGAGKDEQT